MNLFSYGDKDPNAPEYARVERNSRIAIPVVLLVLLLMGWFDYALMAFAKEPVAPDNFVQVTGIVAEDGIHYKAENIRGITSDYVIDKKDGREIGETVTLYYEIGNPYNVGVLGRKKEWWRAIPLTIFTGVDVWVLWKLLKPKERHYKG